MESRVIRQLTALPATNKHRKTTSSDWSGSPKRFHMQQPNQTSLSLHSAVLAMNPRSAGDQIGAPRNRPCELFEPWPVIIGSYETSPQLPPDDPISRPFVGSVILLQVYATTAQGSVFFLRFHSSSVAIVRSPGDFRSGYRISPDGRNARAKCIVNNRHFHTCQRRYALATAASLNRR